MHDFEPGWDTYVERPGYGLEADLSFDQISVGDYDAILILGGRAPEYLRNDRRLLDIVREFDAQQKWILAICHASVPSLPLAHQRETRDLPAMNTCASRPSKLAEHL